MGGATSMGLPRTRSLVLAFAAAFAAVSVAACVLNPQPLPPASIDDDRGASSGASGMPSSPDAGSFTGDSGTSPMQDGGAEMDGGGSADASLDAGLDASAPVDAGDAGDAN